MLEDIAFFTWIVLFSSCIIMHFIYNPKVKKFRKETKADFFDFYESIKSNVFFNNEDAIFLIYILKRKYILTNDKDYIRKGEFLYQMNVAYIIVFILLFFLTNLIIFLS